MRVVALIDNIYKAYGWWRIASPFNALRQIGVDADWCWLDEHNMPTQSIKDSIVVLPRILIKDGSPEYMKQWINKLRLAGARKIIYELDDDIISPNYVTYMKACGRASIVSLELVEQERKQHIELIKLCDAVTVTNTTLANVVQQYTTNPVYVLPNYIDIEWYKKRLKTEPPYQKDKELIHVGCGGGVKPDEDYQILAQAWKYIDKKYKNVRFVIAGYQPNPLYEAVDFDKIIRVPSVPLEEWPASMQVDIGCTPLSDNSFNRCKSPIKVFEYIMADALPIASNVVYFQSNLKSLPIATSVNGWKYFLDYFISHWLDKELHVAALQQEILDKYSITDPENCKKWIKAYES